jgi:hypothetical protein
MFCIQECFSHHRFNRQECSADRNVLHTRMFHKPNVCRAGKFEGQTCLQAGLLLDRIFCSQECFKDRNVLHTRMVHKTNVL